ncbi:MAG: polysaccharide biosynthesis tyrosine autokinase [Acidobacteria bacterium]|nr:polysaccharide biosynthesis tyrosine autokinase [Acidobacteriota bacterium]
MAEFEINLRDIFRVARRRRWILLLAPTLVGALTYFFTESPPPRFEAESVVKITRVAANMQALLVEALYWYQGDNIATQSEIITSQKIKARVALRLAQKYDEFSDMNALASDGDEEEVDYEAFEQKVRNDPILVKLVSDIEIEAEKKGESEAVGILARGSSQELAVDIANYTAEEFVNYNISERNREVRQAVQFIQARIQEGEEELSQAEKGLEEFQRDYRTVISLDVAAGGDILQRIESLGRTIAHLDKGMRQLELIPSVEEYWAFSPVLGEAEDSMLFRLEEQVLQLIVEINRLKSELRRLLRYSTAESREVQEKILETEDLKESGREILSSLLQGYQTVQDELIENRRSLMIRWDQLETVPEITRQLGALERQVTLRTDGLNLFQRRLQDAEIQKASEIKEVTIVEQASLAIPLVQPSRLLKSLAGVLIGLILGGIFSVLLESLDTSIGTIDDVEGYLELPVLGVIPHLDADLVRGNVLVGEMGSDVTSAEIDRMATLCSHFAPQEPVSEAFRSLRAQLEVMLKKNDWKTVLVTSSVLQEGKTNTACNLAVVFGQAGWKTLLIDADLRRPQIHRVFGLSKTPGLSDVLLGVAEWESATKSIDDLILGKFGLKNSHLNPGLEYLFLLTAGRRVDSPAELLNLDKMSGILSEMRDLYDIIIIDIAPVLPVAEASQLAPGIEATLITYQIGRVGREVVNRTKSRLQSVGGNVVGLLMNDIEAEIYYSRDYPYYGYKYKYEEVLAPESYLGILGGLRERFSSFLGRQRFPKVFSGFRSSPKKPSHPSSGDEEMEDVMKLTDEE